MNVIDEIYYELSGVLHDLEHQFNPNDGGVCARTIRRVLGKLQELERVNDNEARGPTLTD